MIRYESDLFVLIEDNDDGKSITNDASNVVAAINNSLVGGLRKRRLYYMDTTGRYDELKHDEGVFKRFIACTDVQQKFFESC